MDTATLSTAAFLRHRLADYSSPRETGLTGPGHHELLRFTPEAPLRRERRRAGIVVTNCGPAVLEAPRTRRYEQPDGDEEHQRRYRRGRRSP